MKKLISIVVFFAVFIQASYQFWILSAFYVNKSYIAAEVCVNRFDSSSGCGGSCFLKKRLSEQEKKQEGALDVSHLNIPIIVHFFSNSLEHTLIPISTSTFFSDKDARLQVIYLNAVFKPPTHLV